MKQNRGLMNIFSEDCWKRWATVKNYFWKLPAEGPPRLCRSVVPPEPALPARPGLRPVSDIFELTKIK